MAPDPAGKKNSKDRRNILRRRRRQEKAAIKKAVQAFAENPLDPETLATFAKRIQSKRSKKEYGDIAQQFASAFAGTEMWSMLGGNVRALLLDLGGGGGNSTFRSELTARLTRGLPTTFVKDELKLEVDYVRHAKFKFAKATASCTDTLLSATGHSITKTTARPPDDTMLPEYLEFFQEHTLQLSGASTLTRVLPKTKHELMRELYASMPALCRRHRDRTMAGANCNAVEDLGTTRILSRKLANVLAATEMQNRTSFAESEERKERLLIFSIRSGETGKIEDVGVVAAKYGPAYIQGNLPSLENIDVKLFDPMTWEIRAPTPEQFFKILKRNNVKFTTSYNPTTCPLHTGGPTWETLLEQTLAQRVRVLSQCDGALAATAVAEVAKLDQGVRKLTKQVEAYHLHLAQYEVARQAVQVATAAIRPGRMVLYRDFVNQHNANGKKVNSLVLVVLYKDTDSKEVRVYVYTCTSACTLVAVRHPTPVNNQCAHVHVYQEPLKKLSIHNVCADPNTNGATAYYVRDVMHHHLSGTSNVGEGLFARQKGYAAARGEKLMITQSGDHGPHFSSARTFYNQTTFDAYYDIEIRDSFLCSYHAFNRCDGAGAVSKVLARRAVRDGKPPLHSADYVAMINQSAYANAVAFDFTKINMSAAVFPPNLKTFGDTGNAMTKACEVVYWCPGLDGKQMHAPGVLRYRLVPGEGQFHVVDMLPRDRSWGKMCATCSRAVQRPVYHKRDRTQCAAHAPAPSRSGIVQPDPMRIAGPQRDKQWQQNQRKGRGAFPCKVAGCSFAFYSTWHHANKHMTTRHNITDPSVLYSKPAARAVAGARRGAAADLESDTAVNDTDADANADADDIDDVDASYSANHDANQDHVHMHDADAGSGAESDDNSDALWALGETDEEAGGSDPDHDRYRSPVRATVTQQHCQLQGRELDSGESEPPTACALTGDAQRDIDATPRPVATAVRQVGSDSDAGAAAADVDVVDTGVLDESILDIDSLSYDDYRGLMYKKLLKEAEGKAKARGKKLTAKALWDLDEQARAMAGARLTGEGHGQRGRRRMRNRKVPAEREFADAITRALSSLIPD